MQQHIRITQTDKSRGTMSVARIHFLATCIFEDYMHRSDRTTVLVLNYVMCRGILIQVAEIPYIPFRE